MNACWIALALLAAPDGSGSAPAGSQPPAQSDEDRKRLEEEIRKELGAQPQAPAAQPSAGGAAPAQPAAPAPTSQQGLQGQSGGNPFARLLLLPDISAIGTGSLAWNHLDVGTLSPRGDPFAPAHTLQPIFQELELGVQAVVDPYARADVFISFGDTGVEIEEAYLTTLSLPYALQIRAGKFFAPIGRINQQHGHVWDFADRPLALARLLGVDALKGPGAELTWLAPVPWFAELDLSYQSAPPSFESPSRNGGYARLIQFFDLGKATALGVGVSGGLLQEHGDTWRQLAGLDVFLKIRPPQGRSYVALQGEVVLRHLDAAPADAQGPFEDAGTLWGGYAQAVYRDGPYWAYGARYERAPALAGGAEHRVSALLGWLPSEFQHFRLQVS